MAGIIKSALTDEQSKVEDSPESVIQLVNEKDDWRLATVVSLNLFAGWTMMATAGEVFGLELAESISNAQYAIPLVSGVFEGAQRYRSHQLKEKIREASRLLEYTS